jgi:hypothetical protein
MLAALFMYALLDLDARSVLQHTASALAIVIAAVAPSCLAIIILLCVFLACSSLAMATSRCRVQRCRSHTPAPLALCIIDMRLFPLIDSRSSLVTGTSSVQVQRCRCAAPCQVASSPNLPASKTAPGWTASTWSPSCSWRRPAASGSALRRWRCAAWGSWRWSRIWLRC